MNLCLVVKIGKFIRSYLCWIFLRPIPYSTIISLEILLCLVVLVMLSNLRVSVLLCYENLFLNFFSLRMFRNMTCIGRFWFAGTVLNDTIDEKYNITVIVNDRYGLFLKIRSVSSFYFSIVELLNLSLVLHCCFYTFLVTVN